MFPYLIFMVIVQVERLFAPLASAGGGPGSKGGGAAACADDRWGGFEEEPEVCRFKAYCEPVGWWAAAVPTR
jgi:hypothetical protein